MATSKKDLECVIAMSKDEINAVIDVLREMMGDIIDIDVHEIYEDEKKMEVLKKLTRTVRMLKNVEVMFHND